MKKGITSLSLLALASVVLPDTTSALTFVQIVGLFHIAVGLLLTVTLGTFIFGICLWIARFNTWPSHRETAIGVLEWGITMLFVLILLIAFVYFVQRHTTIALSIIAFIAIIGAIILVVKIAPMGGGGAEGGKPKPKGGGGH